MRGFKSTSKKAGHGEMDTTDTRPLSRRLSFRIGAGAIVLLAVGLGVASFVRSGQTDFGGFLALLAVVVTAGVSWLAAWLADRRLRLEQTQNNERLRLEAAMQAGALLASSAESVASPATAAAGLLALTKLDHTELAVALLVDLWAAEPFRSSRVCSETAILVIDAALRATTASNAPLIAAELLCRHAPRLNAAQSLHWPSSIDGGWRADFSPQTKLLIIDGLVTMTTTSDAAESALRSLVVRLYGIWKGDPDPHVKGCIALLLGAVKDKICRLGYTNFMHASFNVSLNDIQDATKSPEPRDSDEYLVQMTTDRAAKLKDWSERCVRSYEIGALSNNNCEREARSPAATSA